MTYQLEGGMKREEALGQPVRDTITGFKGICTGWTEYVGGYERAYVEATLTRDERALAEWIDATRLELDVPENI